MKNRAIGSLLILIGTAIGAGMLALPMTTADLHFGPGVILLLFIWAIMTLTGLLVLEVNLSIDTRFHNFSSMAKATLGRPGQVVAWVSCLLLLYALTSAYIAGNASLISTLVSKHTTWQLSGTTSALIFTAIFGGAVYWSTKMVDGLNRGLLSVKGILLLITLSLLMPHIQWQHLFPTETIKHSTLLIAAPVFLTAFGYHTVIPSLRDYLGPEPKKLRNIILIGTSIPLIIYLLWMSCTLGIIPVQGSHSFTSIAQHQGSVGEFIATLNDLVNNHWVSLAINGFSNIAMTTSFLGVTLGLFDFLADALKRTNSRFGRTQTALLTFLPPLLFALFYPKGFIFALGYAAIFVAILEVLLPAAMVYRLRKTRAQKPYQVMGGNALLVFIGLCGCVIIAAQIWNSFSN